MSEAAVAELSFYAKTRRREATEVRLLGLRITKRLK